MYNKARRAYPSHKHNYEHEVFVVDGEEVVIIEGNEYNLKDGFVVTVPANFMHQFRNNSGSDFRFLCMIPQI
ncbi:MAG: cupin domain-containing protein [Myxococcota bacterium]